MHSCIVWKRGWNRAGYRFKLLIVPFFNLRTKIFVNFVKFSGLRKSYHLDKLFFNILGCYISYFIQDFTVGIFLPMRSTKSLIFHIIRYIYHTFLFVKDSQQKVIEIFKVIMENKVTFSSIEKHILAG